MAFTLRAICVVFLAVFMAAMPKSAEAQATFSTSFTPDTIGPGGVSTLTYTITNGGSSPITDLAFTNVLPTVPGPLVIAMPSNATSSCTDATLTAPNGGGTITLSDGRLGAGGTCTVTVDVTAATPGAHTNAAVTLTSSIGSVMSLPRDLTVVTTLPSFSKSFSPSTIPLGGRSTLSFTIDNSLGAGRIGNLDFTDNMPAGIQVASPSNAATDCVSASAPDTILTAVPGSSQIVLNADGSTLFPGFEVLSIGATCTVMVDVTGAAVGTHNNRAELLADFTSAGSAVDALTVTGGGQLQITKAFTDDPVAPGNVAELEFVLQNNDRNFAATNVAFTDDLSAMLTGATFGGMATLNDCGGSGGGTGVFSYSGGTIAAGGNCTIRIPVNIPAGAGAGSYANVTSAITGTIDGSPVTGGAASDNLFVSAAERLIFTKEFITDPVAAGADTIMRFTITNPNAGSAATDIAFDDELTPDLPFPIVATLPASPCGAGSNLGFFFPDSNRQGVRLTGGILAPGGMAGDSCTFDVTLTIPADMPGTTIFSTSDTLSATINGGTVATPGASDSLRVNGGINLDFSKSFSSATVNAGDTVTLEFAIDNTNSTTTVTGLSFTDDLASMGLAGIEFASATANTCNGMATGGFPSTTFGYSGGSVAGGDSCRIELTLNVPGAAATGDYTNTASALTGDAGVGDDAAVATLSVLGTDDQPVMVSQEFIGGPFLPGEIATLRFTIENPNATNDATSISFTESLSSTLSGLATTGALPTNPCGAGSLVTGTTFLTFSSGFLAVGDSCTFDVSVQIPGGAASGTYNSVTGAPTASVGGTVTVGDPATARLVIETAVLEITKTFTDDPVVAGNTATLEITVTNPTTSLLTSASFTDDFDAMLSGTTFSNPSVLGCSGGAGTVGAGSSLLTFSITNLPGGQFCRVTVDVAVPTSAASGSYDNTISDLSGIMNGAAVTGGVATDTLVVTAADAPSFSKAFSAAVVAPTQTTNLTFTITNNSVGTVSGIAFSDDLDAMLTGAVATGLPISACGGTLSGTSFLTFSGGELAGSANCTITATIQIPASASAGSYTNTTSDLSVNGLGVTPAATANLTVEPAPTFAKAFSPSTVRVNEISTLTFTVDNSASALAASSLDFTDTFPSGMVVATPSNASATCSGGTLTAVAGSDTVSYSGGSVSTGATCTVQVDVLAVTQGALANISGDLTSSSGNSGTASDTLTVNPAQVDVSVTKDDGISSIRAGETVTYTITATNAGPSDDPSVSLADTFPTGLSCTYTSLASGGLTGNTAVGAGDLAETLSMPAGSGVTYTATCLVAADATGTLSNTVTATTSITDTVPGNNSATDNDAVVVEPAVSFLKEFSPATIDQGENSTLTFTIDNTLNALIADDLAFTDTFPAGIEVAAIPNVVSGCGGTFSATAGATSASLTGGTVGIGTLCTVSVDVRATGSGALTNTTSDLTSTLPTATGASTTLTVNPAGAPGFAKAFSPATVDQGQNSTLTFTIDNTGNSIEAADLTFTDALPVGLEVAAMPNVVSDCGGTFDAVAAGMTIGLTGGTLAAATSCTIDVDVRALGSGTLVNTSSDLTSSLPTALPATATLTVNAAAAPGFAKSFTPSVISQGETSVLSFTIDNSANSIEAATLAFTDTFPAGMQVASIPAVSNSCGGTFTANAGDNTISLSGGLVDAASSCVIDVSVQGLIAGGLTNTSSDLTSSVPTATGASATLTVNALPLDVSMSFAPSTIEQFLSSTLTYTLSNTSLIDATGLTLNDTLPAGVVLASPANASTTCRDGTLTAPDGGSAVSYTGGSVAASGSCTVTVSVTSDTVGTYPNSTETVTSSLGTSAAANATLEVEVSSTGTITIVQNADIDGAFEFVSDAPELNFTINTASGTGQFGPIPVPAGSYTVTQNTPDGVGTSAIRCTDGDSSGDARAGSLSLNIAALETVTCTFTSVSSRQKTVDTINRFLTKRADLILSSEPSNARRIDRLKRGAGNASGLRFSDGDLQSFLPFTAQISTASDTYSMSTSLLQVRQAAASLALGHGALNDVKYVPNYRWDAWFEAQYKKFDSGSDTGHFAIAYFGADYLVNTDLLIGAMIQIDDMEDRSSSQNSTVSGTGWMAGPYMTARLAPNLYFDGRIAAGTSTNDISPFNTYTDEFTTNRWMASAELTGDFQRGDWTIQPGASLSYFEEKQHAYTDSVGVAIPSQVISLAQVKIGPTFTGQFQTPDGMNFSPFFSIDAIYNFGDTDGASVTNPDTASTDGWRGRIQTGIDFRLKSGTQISFGTSYDGIGRGSLDVWGLTFELNIPIQK